MDDSEWFTALKPFVSTLKSTPGRFCESGLGHADGPFQ